MTVSSNGTPTLTAAAASASMSVTGTWGSGQSRTAGDLLVALVTASGTTTVTLGSTPAGWTLQNSVKAAATTLTAYYTKIATGSDTAPTVAATTTGTAADSALQVTLFDLSDSGGSTPVLWTDGVFTNTSGTIAPFTGSVVPAGSLGIAGSICSQTTTTATTTWTTPTGWTAATSQTATWFSQSATYTTTSAPTAGNAVTCLFTHSRTSTQQSALVLVVSPPASTEMKQFTAAQYVTTGTGTATSGAFTPAAGDLVVALVSMGNGGPGTITSLAVSDSVSGSWTLRSSQFAGTSGGAWVFIKDAGASPSSQTVTATVTGTAVDTGLIVLRFTGAAATVSQTGAVTHVTTATTAITPNTTGSQLVGADGEQGTTALTPNAATLSWGTTTGGAGDRFCLFQGAVATTATVGQTLGWSTSPGANALVAVEIIPLPPGTAGPALRPLSGPVRSHTHYPARGHGSHISGVVSFSGPAIHPPGRPVIAAITKRPRPKRGHGNKVSGRVSVQGPAYRPLKTPVVPSKRGRVSGSVQNTAGVLPVPPSAGVVNRSFRHSTGGAW